MRAVCDVSPVDDPGGFPRLDARRRRRHKCSKTGRRARGNAACSADGKFVFYDTEDAPQKIRKIPVEGGDPVDVAVIPGDQIESQFTLSPDGTRLAYFYRESGDPAALEGKLALLPADGGPSVRVFRMRGEPSTFALVPRWQGFAIQLLPILPG